MLKLMGKKKISNFTLKNFVYLNLWEMLFKEFLNPHLGYPNRTILAILNLDVALMRSTKFQFSTTYGSKDFVCLFDLILYVLSTIFQLNRVGSSRDVFAINP